MLDAMKIDVFAVGSSPQRKLDLAQFGESPVWPLYFLINPDGGGHSLKVIYPGSGD
jgi:hypothetical protein